MSTQLILYPQNYNGYTSTASILYTQFIVNGGWTNSFVATGGLYESALAPFYSMAMLNAPPTIPNQWYTYRTLAGSAYCKPTNFPQHSGVHDGLFLDYCYSSGKHGHVGVYQRVINLTVGQWYDITLEFATQGASLGNSYVEFYIFNTSGGLIQQSGQWVAYVSTFGGGLTYAFQAQETSATIMLDYSSLDEACVFTSLKCNVFAGAPTMVYTDLADGQVICDLYEDEDIPLSLSVDNFKNVAEKVQSYSKSFDLPATKRNNKIFDNIFEITRTDTGLNFNPYVKTKCVLKQDGYILFDGYLRLINIKDKEGEISYSVNLYSEVVALADILKDRTFAELDFSELDHDYDYSEIRNSWQGQLTVNPLPITSYANNTGVAGATTTNVLKYPFVNWTGQISLSSTTNNPVLPSLESAFRPFIRIKYLINKIFELTPFTWSSDFFDATVATHGFDFERLYMDFNWGADNAPNAAGTSAWYGAGLGIVNVATTSYTNLELMEFSWAGLLPFNYNQATHVITATTTNEHYDITYSWNLQNTSGSSATVECKWVHTLASGVVQPPINYSGIITIAAGAYWTYTGTLSIMLQTGDTLETQFKASTGSAIQQVPGVFGGQPGADVHFVSTNINMVSAMILGTLRGELGQWDFLKGIMTMFNLISMPDKDNPLNITFEPYKNIFISDTNSGTTGDLSIAARSIQHDWTDKVDVSEMELTPLTDLNKQTIFKFEEDDDDYAFNVYKNSVGGFLYGSKEFDASAFTVLDGLDEITAEPFAATVIKPLFEQFSDFIVPMIYSSNDGTFEGFDNSPRIMYENYHLPNGPETLTSCTYYVPFQNGGAGDATEDEFLQFSHLSDIPTIANTQDFHFGLCQLINPLSPVPDNLYQVYWAPYYNELYNPDTRTMTLKVNLTPADINTFKFNDKVMIKNQVFRVNKIDYKPNDLAKVEFILIP